MKKMVTFESEIAGNLNNCFSNIAKKLEISNFDAKDSFAENIKNPVIKTMLKYKNDPNVLVI